MIMKIDINRLILITLSPSYCHLPVSCRTLVSDTAPLGAVSNTFFKIYDYDYYYYLLLLLLLLLAVTKASKLGTS